MEHVGVTPNVVTWTSVVSACGVAGRADVAEEVVTRMRAMGSEPNVVTLTALIRAHGRAGHSERSEAVMKQMLLHGPPPNEVCGSLSHLVWAPHCGALVRQCTRMERKGTSKAERRMLNADHWDRALGVGCLPAFVDAQGMLMPLYVSFSPSEGMIIPAGESDAHGSMLRQKHASSTHMGRLKWVYPIKQGAIYG